KRIYRLAIYVLVLITIIKMDSLFLSGYYSVFMITPYQKEAINGLLLSDGHVRAPKGNGNSRMEFTFKVSVLDFINWIKFDVLGSICTKSPPTPYPKSSPTQYWFGTRQLPFITTLHGLWYTLNPLTGKYIKIVPSIVAEAFTGVTLAFWIMGDGFWEANDKTVLLCTESFTEDEVDFLISLLKSELGLVAGKKARGSGYRIRFSRLPDNITRLRDLTLPHMHPLMIYKLGL
uniref:Orf231 protein n=1 Tax=Allomyces macrogynus TaxID=28583 RepID=Q37087_ALLMA